MWDSDRKDVDAAGYYRPEHKIFAESSVKRYGGKVVALYAAPPALVANIHPLLEFAREYIESWDLGMAGDSSLLASAKKAIADSSAHQPAPVSVPDEDLLHMAASAIEDLLSNKDRSGAGVWADVPAKLRRDATLQGAEPVTTVYKLRDAVETIRNSGIVIDADKIFAERDALNSPVIPDGWVMVPVDMSPEMMRAVQINSELGAYSATNLTGAYSLFREFWDVAIAAAPQQEV
ncbi:hypothetical protein [Enterobacter bugandensis]|uniref:hypothetical protein n=1 Tax=Enterobacter bugandensis TaxID=881260 RepID=UPI003B211BEF